jgi:hypothetical protein
MKQTLHILWRTNYLDTFPTLPDYSQYEISLIRSFVWGECPLLALSGANSLSRNPFRTKANTCERKWRLMWRHSVSSLYAMFCCELYTWFYSFTVGFVVYADEKNLKLKFRHVNGVTMYRVYRTLFIFQSEGSFRLHNVTIVGFYYYYSLNCYMFRSYDHL